jgi:hypothetical protein
VPLPANNALSFLNVNIGSQRSQGVEFSITTKNIDGKAFQWTTSFNIADYVNRWLTRDPYNALEPYQGVHDRIDEVYGWETAGIIKSASQVPSYMPLATVGNIIYKDVSGKGQLGTGDVVKLGHTSPAWNLGMTNRFSYKAFDLSVFFYAKLKEYIQSDYAAEGLLSPARLSVSNGQNTITAIKNVWTASNPNGTLPGIASDSYAGLNPSGNNNFFYQNVNYLRLNNVTLGYTWNIKKAIKSIRFYGTVQNLALWTNYKGYDPELSSQSTALGTLNPYPQTLSTTFGLNATF